MGLCPAVSRRGNSVRQKTLMVLKESDFKKRSSLGKKKTNRSTVVILFLGTIGLSGFLWFQQKFKTWWQGLFKPTTYQILKKTEDLEQIIGFKPALETLEGLEKSIDLLVGNLSGTYGIYFYQIEEKESLGINEDQVFIAASVNKIPIMVSFYQEVEKGNLDEEGEYILRKVDIQDYGTGQMRYQPLGTKYTYSELIELTGKKSDNTAAYVLETLIGRRTIQAGLDKLGMKNTLMKENTTTPKEMGDYLVRLYKGELVSRENKEKILTALTDTDFEDRIPKGVPENIRIAHKIGNEIQTYNDCGIVFSSKPYVLCILSNGVKETEALEVIPKISRLVWEFVKR